MLRHRRKTVKAFKKLDAFPKTYEECIETSSAGGTFSIISFGIMVWFIIWECSYYLETKFVFKFKPDTDFKEKLKINIDITVAMPCNSIGADVLDVTGHHVMSYGDLNMEDTWFELDHDQLAHFQGVQRANHYLREEFHSVHEILWRSGYINLFGGPPKRLRIPDREKDACKITGTMTVNKVAGNLHITAGKSIPLPIGHAHVALFMADRDYNFSHRIEKFSFGDAAPGIIQPLEGDEKVTESNMISYQYFLTIVPTKINTYRHFGSSFQYSVTEQSREISHDKGSHGSPGIFFKYDVSALKVDVREEHEPFLPFLTRLIGIIGGIFTCSGLMHRVMGVIVNCIFCRFLRRTTAPESDKKRVALSDGLVNTSLPISSSTPLLQPTIAPVEVNSIDEELIKNENNSNYNNYLFINTDATNS